MTTGQLVGIKEEELLDEIMLGLEEEIKLEEDEEFSELEGEKLLSVEEELDESDEIEGLELYTLEFEEEFALLELNEELRA
jgi:hypothetical protein